MKNKLKIVIGYPPIKSKKGTPLLSQNRQFQYFNNPTYIYPMVPSYAATMLKKNGYKVYWLDGIAEKITLKDWLKKIKKIQPDYLLMETKTPVIKTHWQIINKLKTNPPAGRWKLKIILVGDHVTYLPEESFEHSQVDYVITGGDYDFVIVNLLNHIYKNVKLEGGVYWRKKEKIYNSGPASLKHDLNSLPFIDRDLTKWKLYAYENGNYKYTPGTYMYSGRDCWWNRCTFCIWNHTLNPGGSYRSFSPERLFAEIKHVVDKYRVREIFDDAGTIFAGAKMEKFCRLLIDSGYSKKVSIGCNMRFNSADQNLYFLMKKAGFRFVLYGMESANQKTLDKIHKGIKVADIIKGSRMASKAGLEVHATIMLGYPWESYRDALKTIKLAKHCFKKGFFNSMQATIIIPYPGTPLWKECREKGWLLTEDYNRYDMREPIMKMLFPKEKIYHLEQKLYLSFVSPQYFIRKLSGIRNLHDLQYLFYMAKKLISHLLDFSPKNLKRN